MGLMNDLFVFIVESLKMFYNLLGSLHPEFSDSSSIALAIGLFFRVRYGKKRYVDNDRSVGQRA